MFEVTEAWSSAYPDAHAGVLAVREAANPGSHPELEIRKAALEQSLRLRYAGQDRSALLMNPVLHAYDAYYSRFKKTYHVQLQLESILLKGKSIPSVAALVEAMFMAEMDGLLLTAGHDLDLLRLPLALDVARGNETYTLMRGEQQTVKPGDMLIRDGEGIISTIVYGPDRRTQIGPGTRNAVFTIYGPPGVQRPDTEKQLEQIRELVLLIAPEAKTEMLQVFAAA